MALPTAPSDARPVFPGFAGPDAPLEIDLYRCVHCGFCLNVCPTYLETGLETESPRGRIALMKAVYEGRLEAGPAVMPHWDLCLQCRACEVACPSGVPYGRLMEATRASVGPAAGRSLTRRIAQRIGFRWLLPRPRLLRLFVTALRLYQRTGVRRLVRASRFMRLLPGDLERLDGYQPDLSGKFFVASGQRATALRGEPRARVALLSGCVMPLIHGAAMEAAMRVLARNGIDVIVPAAQGCCGALNVHAGERESARAMARRNIDSFLDAGVDAVVVASAGCGSTMKEYGELLSSDPEYAEKADKLAGMTRDIHEFLVETGFAPPESALDLTVTYQDACHLAHAQRITDAPRELLRAIPGVKLVEMPESSVCCGAGGTYSLTEGEMSAALQARKVANVESTGAAVVASGNPGCVLQMHKGLEATGSDVRVRYVIELLDEAYRAGG